MAEQGQEQMGDSIKAGEARATTAASSLQVEKNNTVTTVKSSQILLWSRPPPPDMAGNTCPESAPQTGVVLK